MQTKFQNSTPRNALDVAYAHLDAQSKLLNSNKKKSKKGGYDYVV